MAATLSLDTLTSAGSGITVATGKTLTVGGKSVTAGSSNIQRATGDVTVATTADYGVAGKSELVIAANAGAATRTITLCPVAETGVDTCIITVVADADATSTYKLTVVESDGSTEVWTGYQTGDFVRLIVSNSAWLVVDHKETYYSRFYLTADQAVASSASAQITGWTENEDIGNMWVSGDNEIVTPTDMNGFIDVSYMTAKNGTYAATNPALKLDGVYLAQWNQGGAQTDNNDNTGMCGGIYPVTTAQELEFWASNSDSNDSINIAGGSKDQTHFTVKFTRTY